MISLKNSIPGLVVLLLSGGIIQCKSQTNHLSNNSSKLEENSIKQDTLITRTYNTDNSLLLEVKELRDKVPMAEFYYKVTRATGGNVVKEGHFKGSGVQWNDQHSLKLIPYVGIVQKPQSENPDDLLIEDKGQQVIIVPLKEEDY